MTNCTEFRGMTPWRFHNALTANATSPVSMGATLIHIDTHEEIAIDIICDDDSFATFSDAVRRFYDRNWGIYETWVISGDASEFAPMEVAA